MKKSDIKEMRALSVIQPWAHCIVHEGKNVENRPRITHLRGTVAIHSSAKVDQERFDWLKEDHGIKLDLEDAAYGAIVGFADIVDVVTKKTLTRDTKKWFVGEYGYVLANVVALKEPIPAKGALGFWRIKGRLLEKCVAQLSERQISRFRPFGKE